MDIDSFTTIKALALVGKTTNAYMFEDYGTKEWFQCICFLLLKGYDADATMQIVRSKHMRWSSDARGIQTSDEFIRYYGRHDISIIKEYSSLDTMLK